MMEGSEGGRGSRAHSPELVVTCVLVVTPVLVVTCVRSWALAIIHEGWWLLWLVVVHVHCGSWVMVKGARRRG